MLYSGSITDVATNVKQCRIELYICSTVVYNILFHCDIVSFVHCNTYFSMHNIIAIFVVAWLVFSHFSEP